VVVRSNIGETVRELREAAGKSLKDLADDSGVHWNAIARIERGERQPDYDTVVTLLGALGKELRIVGRGR
jgi:transcriptional regulator with XRE-family HTH domain